MIFGERVAGIYDQLGFCTNSGVIDGAVFGTDYDAVGVSN
jgi:hypothetical protein